MTGDGIRQKYVDDRNWAEYNERLVRRGELYLDLDFLRNWDREVSKMNRDKRGRPYEYPETFVRFMAFVHILFYLPYRQMEGFLRKLSKFVGELKAADYTTLFKRIAELELQIDDIPPSEPVIIALDSSGVKVTNRGEWMRERWKRCRGRIKVHIAVDVKRRQVLALEVTNEHTGDSKKFKDLVEKAEDNLGKDKIKRVLADGGYDAKDNFNLLRQKGIESGIKTRENASTRARGSPYRAKCVRERRKLGYEKWKERYGYGQRWAAEGILSAVKRIMGESVRATSPDGMFREVKMKFIFYNMLLSMT
ncbi:MAG: IS5 family transposase [Methanocellales archaeon]|nr:IS5 family transposase [Methanocellales archaeon]